MTQGYVALLRGVNVGGARPLPMEALRALFAEAGAKSVESLIQSGNVVFAATEASAPQILAESAPASAGSSASPRRWCCATRRRGRR